MFSAPGLLLVAGSYLLGSVSFAALAAKMAGGIDLRGVGSGNLGATNAGRALGLGWGLAVYAMDLLKGLGPVLLAEWLRPGERVAGALPIPVLCAAAALLGHCFPVFHRFKGGKGVATASGIVLAHSWPAFLVSLLGFAAGVALSRMVSAGSILAAAVLPVAYIAIERREALSMPNLAWLTLFLLMGILVIVLHRGNILRIAEGKEPRIGAKDP